MYFENNTRRIIIKMINIRKCYIERDNMNMTEKTFNKLPYLGEGTEGIVRKLNDKYAVKKIYDEEFYLEKQKSISTQCEIKQSSLYIFPCDVLFISKIYKGYVQKIVKGKKTTKENLNNLKKDIEIIRI